MNRTSISDIKTKAKDNLLGCYGLATGSFALLFAILYGLMAVLMGALMAGMSPLELNSGTSSTLTEIKSVGISLVSGAFSALLTTGYSYLMMEVSYGRRPKVKDIFYCFTHHPDKIIIVYAILTAIQWVLLLPSRRVQWSPEKLLTTDGKKFLLWVVLLLAGLLIGMFISIIFGFSFLIYVDDPNMSVKDIMMCSQKLMRGNIFRYIYLILSFIGYALLGILSLGVTLMFTVPYQNMAVVEFYKDALSNVDRRNTSENQSDNRTIDVEIGNED